MKTIHVLKRLITIYYYLLCFGFIGLFTLPFLFFLDKTYELKYDGSVFDIGALATVKKLLIIILFWGLYLLYFKAIQFLKNSLQDLSEGNYFSDIVIESFRKAGRLLLYCAAGSIVVGITLSLILNLPINLGIDTDFVLFIIMGLFFMFLSEVFLKAKRLQDENDLTV